MNLVTDLALYQLSVTLSCLNVMLCVFVCLH